MQRRGTRARSAAKPGEPVFAINLGAPVEPGEQDMLERQYRREIERTFAELDALTRGFQGGVDSLTAVHVKNTLKVLSRCYHSSALTTQALDILAQHLRALRSALEQDYASTFS